MILTGLLLLIPLGFRWHWHLPGYLVFGALIFGVGVAYQAVTRKCDLWSYKLAVGIAFVTLFALAWGSLVQFFDVTPVAVIYYGVPIVAGVGAAMVRLEPEGMSRVMAVVAAVQFLDVLIALGLQWLRKPALDLWTAPEWRGLIGNTVDGLLFVVSALLFRRAGREVGTLSAQ